MANETVLQTIEQKALRIYEINRLIATMETEKALLKASIAELMKEHKTDSHVFRLDDSTDLRVTVGVRTTTKLDKEELASDLGISVSSAGKKDVLIKKTEEGELSFNRYKGYEYTETKETIMVRRVGA